MQVHQGHFLCGVNMKVNKLIGNPFALSLLFGAGVAQAQVELPTVTVTATREEEKISETPISVGVVPQQSIQITKPTHPFEILGQVPGVSVSVTNGEGHQTAIRQGFTTSPVYLFLEDGIPIRATGNFNHNALYEVNIPGAGGIEVIRGPGSALHGSDAIGGIVNVITKMPKAQKGQDLSVELGEHGYRRLLGGFDTGSQGAGALRADINLTHTDGWRLKTGYDRQSLNLRWDAGPDDRTIVKTILGYTKIDQETGANSALPWNLYQNDPTVNLRSPAYRKVDAFRLSTAIERDLGQGALLTFTPYFRSNKMDLNGSYNFTGDARIENTEVFSLGLLAKYRKDLNDSVRSRVIVGLDLDHSPSSRKEDKITLASTSIGPNSLYTQYTGYTIGDQMYNYDVVYQSASPYVHYEMSPFERIRLTAGLRYDNARYEMDNNRSAGYFTVSGREYYSPAEASASFSRLSPKLGATYAFNAEHHAYVTYNQGFRTPSESQLFRGGRSATGGTQTTRQAEALALFNASTNLKAIKADQYEIGLRGTADKWNYDVVAYVLTKKDDLLSQRDDTGYSVQTNNGTTEHKGIELGLGRSFNSQIRLDAALSYAKHTYKDWVTSSVDYSGKEIESSPRFLGNVRLTVRPVQRLMTQLEWVRIGSYYLDAENTYGKYSGHDLFNLRASVDIAKQTTGFLRVMNLADKRYADSASQSSASGGLYSPGLPRTVYAGIESRW
jgi:outer membrane receptor protein involved in Fe transport